MAQSVTFNAENLSTIRVLAADSTRMNSQLLAEALSREAHFQVADIDPKPETILAAIAQQRPHVVVISSALEESSSKGFDLTRHIRDSYPDTRVVLLMDTSKRSDVIEAFRSGAHGVFSRTESPKALAKCISKVHEGQVWANNSEVRFLVEALSGGEPVRLADSIGHSILSKREHDVVLCVAEGLSNREIAARLHLTEHTVKNYLFRIFDKLGVSSRVEVALYVFRTRRDSGNTGSRNRVSSSGQVLTGRAGKNSSTERIAV